MECMHWLLLRLLPRAWALYCHTVIPVKLHLIVISDMFAGSMCNCSVLLDCRTDVLPDLVTCNTAISACSKGEQWQLALHLLQDLVATKSVADCVSYNSAVSACCAGSEWKKVFQILQLMAFNLILPDSITPGPHSFQSAVLWSRTYSYIKSYINIFKYIPRIYILLILSCFTVEP